jgi:hypothetical protein
MNDELQTFGSEWSWPNQGSVQALASRNCVCVCSIQNVSWLYVITSGVYSYGHSEWKIFYQHGYGFWQLYYFSGLLSLCRDPRGFAIKFYTDDGIWDLVGNNTPVFFIRDPLLFPLFIHTQKRNPATHLKVVAVLTSAFWDYNCSGTFKVHRALCRITFWNPVWCSWNNFCNCENVSWGTHGW